MSFSVAHSCPKLAWIRPPSTAATCSGWRFFSPRKGMNVNAAHQIAAESIDSRTAMPLSMPKTSCSCTTTRFADSRIPPPR